MKEQTVAKIDTIENVRLVNVKTKKQKLIGHIVMHEGHTIYEWNRVLFQLDKATIETDNTVHVDVQSNTKRSSPKKIIVKENCYYFTSLNEENAVKKVIRKFKPPFVLALD
jgi:hypothetical protein